jgi:hypothetical protein
MWGINLILRKNIKERLLAFLMIVPYLVRLCLKGAVNKSDDGETESAEMRF